jgi:hypothetical protein
MKKSIEKAEAVLADLNANREALVARGHELEARLQEVAFAAHTGNKAERTKLDETNSELLTHQYELSSLDSAIAEATKRLAAADAAEAQAADKEKAKALRVVTDRFMQHAIALDDALTAMSKEAVALRETLIEIHGLGSPFPSFDQLSSLGYRAVATALQSSPWRREFEYLTPGQRQNIVKLVTDWVDRIKNSHIKPRIGELEVA